MLLLDTHVVVWISLDAKRLSKKARMAIEDTRKQAGGLFISDVTFFEVASLVARQRLGLHISLETFLEEVESRFAVLPITRHIAARAVQLPSAYPRDPVDRIIGATAIIEGLPLVTADRAIQRAKAVRTVW
ncbi:MAG: type II toxin-antitoxin system VapC family toxin [Terriglobales bacterium]